MNGFDIRAVGWVVTRDACYEGARVLLGLEPRLGKLALQELGRHWAKVVTVVQVDRRAMSFGERILLTGSASLSKRSEEAVQEFLERLAILSPRLYDSDALRARCLRGSIQVVAGCVLLAVFGHSASPENPTIGHAAIAAILLTAWSFMTTFQLCRMYRLAKHLLGHRAERRRDAKSET